MFQNGSHAWQVLCTRQRTRHQFPRIQTNPQRYNILLAYLNMLCVIYFLIFYYKHSVGNQFTCCIIFEHALHKGAKPAGLHVTTSHHETSYYYLKHHITQPSNITWLLTENYCTKGLVLSQCQPGWPGKCYRHLLSLQHCHLYQICKHNLREKKLASEQPAAMVPVHF